MPVNLYVSGDSSVFDLSYDDLNHDIPIFIHNDPHNPASKVFLNLFDSENYLDIHSPIKADDSALDLIILLKNNTHIHNGDFQDFKRVMITDQRVLERTDTNIILEHQSHKNTSLKIDDFRTNEGYIYATQIELLNGGIVKTLLGIVLHGELQNIFIEGSKKHFIIEELAIKSAINSLTLNKVRINQSFTHDSIKSLTVHDTHSKNDWELTNIGCVKELSLSGIAKHYQFSTDSISITNLHMPAGKFYISAKSYIKFHVDKYNCIRGTDLVLDMSDGDSLNKKVLFPAVPFSFESVTIINAHDVSIVMGGSCRKLLFQNCAHVDAQKITAGEVTYSFLNQQNVRGKLSFSGHVYNNLSITGCVETIFYDLEVNNLEGIGLCKFNFHGDTICKMLQLNLNIDAYNPPNIIAHDDNKLSLTIDNQSAKKVIIDVILAKLSVFYVKGKAELGEVLIQPINKIPNLFWVNTNNLQDLSFNRMIILSECQLCISPDGTINLVQTKNQITSGDMFASISSANVKQCAFVSVGGSIIFKGSLVIEDGDGGLKSKYGDIFINGKITANNQLSIIAEQGLVHVQNAVLKAKCLTIYSGTGAHISDTVILAINFVATTLNGLISCNNVNLRASNIVIVAEDNISITNSSFKTNKLFLDSGNNTTVMDSDIGAHSMFTNAVRQFLIVSSNIDILHHPHVLFADQIDKNHIQGGFRVAKDIQVVGIFGVEKNQPLANISWHRIDFRKNVEMHDGQAYIDSENGFIVGSNLSASDSIIIRTTESLEVVPLLLHNELLDAGGYNTSSIKKIVSKINAGLIDIEASKAALFVGTFLKAATGKINADVIYALDLPEDIKNQQERIKELGQFGHNSSFGKTTLGKIFDFSKATSVAARISNLNVYDNYSSSELYFTQKTGDLVLDKSIDKYEKLHVTASHGKILITSPNLQNIYQGSGGGNIGKKLALDARTVIGGGEVYLVADEVVSEAGKFNVTGMLKIVAKDGVYLLPVSVHQSLMHHKGSKTTISEHEVRLVVSEINAGYLDIKAGGALTAVSSLIKATGINLDVHELNLLSEREIFEKRIVFEGKEKWQGGSNESMDYFKDELVIPTLIKTNYLHAKVNGKTTIEAAQILVKEESQLMTGGDVSILAKYDIHLHDHTSSKSYVFNFHKGKLTVAGTKTIKEHFYGEAPVPTIYYNQGDFYGYSDGKVHLLGSKIIADNLYLVAKKGITLEAMPFHQEQIVSINKEGVRIGFSSGGGKHSVDAEFFSEQDNQQYSRTFHDASELIARNHLTLQTLEQIEIISSKLKFTTATVKARGLHIHTHANIVEQQQQYTAFSMGLHVGIQENISTTVNTVGKVLNKTGIHWLDILDRALNGYAAIEGIKDIYQDVEQLTTLDPTDPESNQSILDNLKSVQYGVWTGAKASTSVSNTKQTQAVDNEIIGGDIEFDIVEDAVIEGIKCNVDNFRLKARNLFATASHDTAERETYSSNIEITIPIDGSVRASVSAGYKQSELSSQTYHSDNVINVTGKLELDLSENGEIKGIRLHSNIIDIKAKNLVVESLQDVLKERMRGMDISVSIGDKEAWSFGAKAQMHDRDKVWTGAIASIVGREVVNVTVQQTLEIAGALIANADIAADGKLTDKGRANIQAGKIIAKTLHNYDNGYSYGLGINLSKSVNAKTGEIKCGVKVPVVYSFNESNRDLLPTIGQGTIDLTEEPQLTKLLNRDISQHIGSTSTDKASLDASLPISDIWESIKPKTGINAGDQPEFKKQEEEVLEQRDEVVDVSPDKELLDKLLQNFELDQDSEIARMLKVLKESQKPTLTVTGGIPMPGITIATTDQIIPIYDVNKSESTFFNYSKVTYVINELFGIQSASANPLVLAVPTGIELWLGSSIIVGGVLYKMDNEYQASTNYSRVYTPNAPEGSYLPALTSNPMLSGLNTGLFANTIDQMRFDGIIPEVDTSTARNNSVGNHGRTMPIAHTATSALLQEIRMDIDPNASKPTILSTPIAYQPKSILFTPDDRSTFVQWSQLPGFSPHVLDLNDLREGRDIHETHWKDLILFNEETPQSRKCEKGESEIWQELDNYKVIQGKQVKTNSLSGKEKRYYQWDDWHKEIEVYDRHGRPLEVIDPVKGEIIPKSVKEHFKIKL